MTWVDKWIDYLTAQYAVDRLHAELDAAGITDPEKRERAARELSEHLATRRAKAEAARATKH